MGEAFTLPTTEPCLTDGPRDCWGFGDVVPTSAKPFDTWAAIQPYLVEPVNTDGGIFGFAEFVQAFAILILVYTLSDVRYRFRVQAAAINVRAFTFWLIIVIATVALLSDYWFTNKFPVLVHFPSRALIQTVLASLFLLLIIVWLWYAFISPPVFSKWNAHHFFVAVRNYVVDGAEADLPTIASELRYSAASIVANASDIPEPPILNDPHPPRHIKVSRVAKYADTICLILGSRKIARHIIASSPITAIVFFQEISKQKRYGIRLGQFASNIVTEAILHKDSIIFHENDRFSRGYLEITKPFTKAAFGDYTLVEQLASANGRSSLDLDISLRTGERLSAEQMDAYARGLLTTLGNALEVNNWRAHSYTLTRSFSFLASSVGDLYELNDTAVSHDASKSGRLEVVTRFFDKAIGLLDRKGLQRTVLRHRDDARPRQHDIYDMLADLCFELVDAASSVNRSDFTGWDIQHNSVWSRIVGFNQSPARRIVLFKLRRLIYDEITRHDHLNYKTARILGFCLNVLGLKEGRRNRHREIDNPIRMAAQAWARKNFLHEYRRNPDVALSVLTGTLTFDEKNKRLVKTYMKGLQRKAPQDFLRLDERRRSRRRRPRAKRANKKTKRKGR